MPGPLEGIKVLDFCMYGNGPAATASLAEQGADVVKVEPLGGDRMRDPPGKFGPGFEVLNRMKRSIAMDVRTPEMRPVLDKLIAWADVICENFRPGVMARLGLGYEDVKKINPKIIFCSNSGFGPVGEWSGRPSYDLAAQAFTGAMTAMGGGPSHPPMPTEWSMSDLVGAMSFHSTILSALLARERTGKGQLVLTSQTAATLYLQRVSITRAAGEGKARGTVAEQRDDGKRPGWRQAEVQQICRAADGKHFVVILGSRASWQKWCSVLARPDLLTDARSRGARARAENKEWLLETINATTATKPRQDWIDACVGADVVCAPVQSYAEVITNAHLRENQYVVDVAHPEWGHLPEIPSPAKYSETPTPPIGISPKVGEHSEEILRMLGYSDTEVAGLLAGGQVKRLSKL